MKRTALVKRLNDLGWTAAGRGKGSHEICVHPRGTRPIPVPRHGNDVPDSLARIILKQAETNVRVDDRRE